MIQRMPLTKAGRQALDNRLDRAIEETLDTLRFYEGSGVLSSFGAGYAQQSMRRLEEVRRVMLLRYNVPELPPQPQQQKQIHHEFQAAHIGQSVDDNNQSGHPDASNATVESREETAYNPPDQPRITGEKDVGHVQGPLHDYLKSLGVPQSRQPELAAKIDAFAKAEITGREAAPVAEPATHPRDLSKPQVVAVIEDSTLGRLHRRYTELVASVELPKEGFKTLDQAKAAGRLASTFDNLQARRKKVGLEPLPSDARVTEARRLKSLFYYRQAPRSGRSQRAATLG